MIFLHSLSEIIKVPAGMPFSFHDTIYVIDPERRDLYKFNKENKCWDDYAQLNVPLRMIEHPEEIIAPINTPDFLPKG